MLGDYLEVDDCVEGHDDGVVPFDIAFAEHLPYTLGGVSAKAYLIVYVPAANFNYLLVM